MNLAVLALLSTSFIWAYAFFPLKVAVEQMPILWVVFYRFLIGTIVLIPFLLKRKWSQGASIRGIYIGIWFFIFLVPLLSAFRATTISNSSFLLSTYIIIVPILGVIFFREPINAQKIIACLLAISGIWLLTGGLESFSYGDFYALGAAFFAAFHLIGIDRATSKGDDQMVNTFLQLCTVLILSSIVLFFSSSPIVALPKELYPHFFYIGVINTPFAIWLQVYGQNKVNAWHTCILFAIEPLITALLAIPILNERIGLHGWIGGGFIVTAILVAHYKKGGT